VERYYYLAATLVSPQFGQEPPIGIDALRDSCDRLASQEDARMVRAASLVPPEEPGEAPGLLAEFWRREIAVRNELVRLRAQKLGRKAEGYLRDSPGAGRENEAVDAARRAFSSGDPFEAEKILEKARWDWIESEASGHGFDSDFLAAYALKILILTRLSAFSEERGVEGFDSMYAQILDNSRSGGEQTSPAAGEWR
jgi:hypothetical protein